jgi:prepilin-type N-terminal cleavage/methylation domain-containing protein
MKKHLGFTLVELLAVFVILGIILFIAVPNIQRLITQSRVSAYNSQIELFKDAARKYVLQYSNEIKNPNNVTVSLYTLMDKKLIDRNIKNPITNQPFENIRINIKKVDDQIAYTILEPLIMEPPALVAGLIPVYYDFEEPILENRWKKADSENSGNSWYNYDEWQWANAVTVANNRETYMNASEETPIPMTDINTMWVWIPRYKYRISAGSGPREIEVEFENRGDKSTGNAVDTFLTHPAFTFGNDELPGIWVGKFETSGTSDIPIIKPNSRAINNLTVKAAFDSIRNNMQSNTTTYGFTNDNNIHMMKNTEWGAVAYLSHSKYGKWGNSAYEGINKEVYVNNSSTRYTGRSMGAPGGYGKKVPVLAYTGEGYYTIDGYCAHIHNNLPAPCNVASGGEAFVTELPDKTLAYGASTTGTIYGIYDMVGGQYEYVMGVYKPEPLPNITDKSGFSSTIINSQFDLLPTDSKYYDQYLGDNIENGHLGDATWETDSWYGDEDFFVQYTLPWFMRGDSYTSNNETNGIFCIRRQIGDKANTNGISFRVVIAPYSSSQ